MIWQSINRLLGSYNLDHRGETGTDRLSLCNHSANKTSMALIFKGKGYNLHSFPCEITL